uniref:Uncharacterized protein n=1 Tax=Ciona intestinalis TaxID=7719 RepID=F7AUS0_CIOIN
MFRIISRCVTEQIGTYSHTRTRLYKKECNMLKFLTIYCRMYSNNSENKIVLSVFPAISRLQNRC